MYLVGSGSGCGYLTSCGGSGGGGSGGSGGGSGGGWGGSGGRTDPWSYGPPGDVHNTLFEFPPVQIVRTPRAVTPAQQSIGLFGCSGIVFRLGACASERTAAGSTPQEVRQSLIGAGIVLLSAIPIGDLFDMLVGGGDAVDPIAARLQMHTDQAVADFKAGNIGLSPAQARAAAADPSLEPAFRGQVIDAAVKQAAANDPELGSLYITRSGELGPDFLDLNSVPGTPRWYDVTTEDNWRVHVSRYAGFGNGTGIFYGGG
jgi:hypothetical protein